MYLDDILAYQPRDEAEAGDKQEGERKAAPRRRRRHRSKGGGRPAGTQGEG